MSCKSPTGNCINGAACNREDKCIADRNLKAQKLSLQKKKVEKYIGAIFWHGGWQKQVGPSPEEVLAKITRELEYTRIKVGNLTYRPADGTIYSDRATPQHVPIGIIFKVK